MSSVSNPFQGSLAGAGAATVRGGFFVTVADSGDLGASYASISGAFGGPFNAIYIIGDTTEPGNAQIVVPTSGLHLTFLNNSNLDLGSGNFVWTNDAVVQIDGNGTITSTAGTLFDFAGNPGGLNVKGITIAAPSGTLLTDGTEGRFTNIVFTSGIVLSGTRNMITASNMSFLEVDASAVNAIVSSSLVDVPIVDNGSGTMLADIKTY